jgi:hypothetical protein
LAAIAWPGAGAQGEAARIWLQRIHPLAEQVVRREGQRLLGQLGHEVGAGDARMGRDVEDRLLG